MPPPPKPVARAADANLSRVFDPWNSVGAGHQRPETRGPGGWRESRALKMNHQLRAGFSGGERIHDTVGAGSLDFDEKLGVVVPKELRARIGNSVADMLRRQGSGTSTASSGSEGTTDVVSGGKNSSVKLVPPDRRALASPTYDAASLEGMAADDSSSRNVVDGETTDGQQPPEKKKGIFENLVIYVNGSTHHIISDHRLKQLLAENGAKMSFHLGRRQVTHVIIGKPAARYTGAGGGLAGGKLEKEIRRVGGVGVKYVGVEWVMESIKAGKRLPEARFANLKVAARGQQSVYGLFGGAKVNNQGTSQGQPSKGR